MVIFHTNLGDIHIELDMDKTPMTCENFLNYVRSGHYNDSIFHRIIPGFVVQGGGFSPDMLQKETLEPIGNEADSGEKNLKGSLSMARTQDPHSATSQFFINLADNAFLDHRQKSLDGWGYCVFGRVTEGMDVVEAMAKVQTGSYNGHQDVPLSPIVIESAEITEDE